MTPSGILQSDGIIDGMAQLLFAPQIPLGGFNRRMTEKELDMFTVQKALPLLLPGGSIVLAAQIRAFRAAWKQAGHTRTPRISVSLSIFALVDDRDRGYFGRGSQEEDKIGLLDENTRAVFGRSYAAEPDILIEQLRKDEAIAEADTLLLTIPNQLGVAYNAHVIGGNSDFGRPSSKLALNRRHIR